MSASSAWRGLRVASRRRAKDRLATLAVTTAGIGVLATILLLLFYLVWEAVPLLRSPTISFTGSVPWAGAPPLRAPLRGAQAAHVPSSQQGFLLQLQQSRQLRWENVRESVLLPGARSAVVALDDGRVQQYALTRRGTGFLPTMIRELDTAGMQVQRLLVERDRRVVFVLGEQGRVQLHHTTASRRLLDARLTPGADWQTASVAVDGSELAAYGDGHIHHWRVQNLHPAFSLSALWRSVWYEDYTGPEYLWQSTPAPNGGEAKFGLTALALGTFKAAFYTMLIAAPLGVAAAIYTAYFMGNRLRRVVKPGIELMEAFPTVVLGFIGGLWLAPRIEEVLAAVLLMPVILLAGVVLLSAAWNALPSRLASRVSVAALPVLLVPWLLLLICLCVSYNALLEQWFFAGDIKAWLQTEFGIVYQQRNALVIGIAMGFAVIPTVFSITEDAVFSVPRSLSDGSLALGATRWQTLTAVVLPTASPGVFSALMIGLGRALGETMIVLMATGNTPIMDGSLFTGLRSVSATIAMETPEAIVGSTHFRILFLSALLLFAFTFVINTVAELVRQRLRFRYASL